MVIFTYENYLEYEKYLNETKEKDLINKTYGKNLVTEEKKLEEKKIAFKL